MFHSLYMSRCEHPASQQSLLLNLQDYRGSDVTAENFLSVLAGEEPAVIGSSGKVIKSGPDDRVFVFYADHGAPGTPHFLQILVNPCQDLAVITTESCLHCR